MGTLTYNGFQINASTRHIHRMQHFRLISLAEHQFENPSYRYSQNSYIVGLRLALVSYSNYPNPNTCEASDLSANETVPEIDVLL